MLTLRQLERLWRAQNYEQLMNLFLETRLEGSLRLRRELARPMAAAAMLAIRLDELNQAYTPFCREMIRTILATQEPDGGWGDPATTAICLRALLGSQGDGLAIEHGLEYLATLQKSDGLWPRIPLKRMPADAFVSAFILFELADQPRFAQKVRLADTYAWFEKHASAELDLDTARLWRSALARHDRVNKPSTVASWS